MKKVKFEKQNQTEYGRPVFMVKVDNKKIGILKSDEDKIWIFNEFYHTDKPDKIGEVKEYYDDEDERAYTLDEAKNEVKYDYGRTEEEYEEDARRQEKIEKRLDWLLND